MMFTICKVTHFVFSYYYDANLLIKFELLAICKLKVLKNWSIHIEDLQIQWQQLMKKIVEKCPKKRHLTVLKVLVKCF